LLHYLNQLLVGVDYLMFFYASAGKHPLPLRAFRFPFAQTEREWQARAGKNFYPVGSQRLSFGAFP